MGRAAPGHPYGVRSGSKPACGRLKSSKLKLVVPGGSALLIIIGKSVNVRHPNALLTPPRRTQSHHHSSREIRKARCRIGRTCASP